MLQRSLKEQREAVGSRDAGTLRTINQLASLLYNADRPDEALPYYSEMCSSCCELLGRRHRDSLLAMHNLGRVHLALGQLEDARPLLQEAAAGATETFGAEHAYTASFTQSVAKLEATTTLEAEL